MSYLPHLAASGYGVANFLGAQASRRQHAALTLLVSQAVAWPLVLACAMLKPGQPHMAALAVGAGAGTLGFLGALLAYGCFSLGRPQAGRPGRPIGYAALLIGTASALVPAAAGPLKGQWPGWLGGAGLVLGCLAIAALRAPNPEERRLDWRVSVMAVGAGAAFGGYHVAMSFTRRVTGWWPLVSSQTVIVVLGGLVVIVLAWRRTPLQPGWAGMGLAAADGGASTFATIMALPALWKGNLPIVGMLIALSPVVTVVLGWVFLREYRQLTWRAGLGLVLAAVGAILLTHPRA